MDNKPEKKLRSHVQLEQLKLLKTEKELEKLLCLIKENINTLKVEELQLKSNEIQNDIKPKLEISVEDEKICYTEVDLDQTDEINKQNLFLDVFGNLMEEEEENDSS